MLFYAYIGIASFVVSLVGTRLTILALRRKSLLMDRPNPRSNHKIPTPRGGGIAIVTTLAIFLMLCDAPIALMLALLMLASVSLLDDIMPMSPMVRLSVQIAATVVALPSLGIAGFSHGFLPLWAESLLVITGWLWFINLFNFMDGIDGLAAAEMISVGFGILIVCAIMGFFPQPLPAYGLVICAVGAGFIWWNWQPAKIFMGDVGSIPVGFLLGYLMIMACREGFAFAAFILPAYFIADSTLTLIRRAMQGKKVWQAHSEHFYQRAVRSGKSHEAVVRHVFGVNMLLVLLAVYAELTPEIAWLNLLTAYTIVLLLLVAYTRMYRRHVSAKTES